MASPYRSQLVLTMATNPLYNNKKWKAIRLTVLKRDDYTCAYCGRHANTVDHITPLAHDPTMAYDSSNLVAACTRCNSAKQDRIGFFRGKRNAELRFERKANLRRRVMAREKQLYDWETHGL
jgi:uncharacterized protein (TIGR02646 family)